MKQETIETRAKRIVKGARHKLTTNPTLPYMVDGETFWYKEKIIGVYYYTEKANKESVLVAVGREGKTIMPYYLKCIIEDGKEVSRGFCQEACLDKDYSEYNNVLTEVLEGILKVIIKRKGGNKKGIMN